MNKFRKKTKRRIVGNARYVQANESEQKMDTESELKITMNQIDNDDVHTKNDEYVTRVLKFESSSGYEEEMEFERPFAERSSSGYEPYDSDKPIPLHPKYRASIRKSMKKQRANDEAAISVNAQKLVKLSFQTMSDREAYFANKRKC